MFLAAMLIASGCSEEAPSTATPSIESTSTSTTTSTAPSAEIEVRPDSIGRAHLGMTRPELEDSLSGTTHQLGGPEVIGEATEGFPIVVDGRDAYWVIFDEDGTIDEGHTTDPQVVGPSGLHVGMSLRDAVERFGEPTFRFYAADRAFELVDFANGFDDSILIETVAGVGGVRAGEYDNEIGEDRTVPITTMNYDPNGVIRIIRVVRPFEGSR